MGRHAQAIELTPAERDELERRVRARSGSQQAALRARIVLLAAAGLSNTDIRGTVGVGRATAWTVFDSWMAERDPQFVEQAVAIIELELPPPTAGPTFLVDEKTGIGVHEPTAPSQPVAPDQPARQEFEYVRHGTADLLAAFAL